jgi:hypothetical protein
LSLKFFPKIIKLILERLRRENLLKQQSLRHHNLVRMPKLLKEKLHKANKQEKMLQKNLLKKVNKHQNLHKLRKHQRQNRKMHPMLLSKQQRQNKSLHPVHQRDKVHPLKLQARHLKHRLRQLERLHLHHLQKRLLERRLLHPHQKRNDEYL